MFILVSKQKKCVPPIFMTMSVKMLIVISVGSEYIFSTRPFQFICRFSVVVPMHILSNYRYSIFRLKKHRYVFPPILLPNKFPYKQYLPDFNLPCV